MRSGEPAVTVLPWDEPFADVEVYGIRHAAVKGGTSFLSNIGSSIIAH